MDHYGIIIRRLRKLNGYSLKVAASKIERSVGWLSEIENNRGFARLGQEEFDRIIQLFDGVKHRKNFKTWVSNEKRTVKADRSLDGAVIKHLRTKLELSLDQASQKIGISKRYLSNLENGHKPVKLEMRNRILSTYGYATSSFRDLADDGKRSKAVPIRYKIKTLINQLEDDELVLIYRQTATFLSQRIRE